MRPRDDGLPLLMLVGEIVVALLLYRKLSTAASTPAADVAERVSSRGSTAE